MHKLRPLLLSFLLSGVIFPQAVYVQKLPNGLQQLPPSIRNCRVSDGSSVYLIDNSGLLRPVTAAGNNNVWNGNLQDIPVDPDLVNQQAKGPLIDDGVFVSQSPGDPTIYLIDHGKKRGIRAETWETCQIKDSIPVIRHMSDEELASIPTGDNLEIVLAQAPPPPVPEPMDVKSTSCGIFDVTTARASCPAWHQHAVCWQDAGFGSCTPKCECRDGAAKPPPPPPDFPPTGHWDVVTFTSANSGNGNITLIAPSGEHYGMQDVGAEPSKIAEDVSFACLNLHLSCPRNGLVTIAIPFGATLTVNATVENRAVTK
jgi:hypothetical protein